MKIVLAGICSLLIFAVYAQRDLTPSKKRDAFGTRDLRNLNNYGIQFQLGATTFLTRLNNEQVDVATTTDGFRGNYTHDPYGKVGAFAEIGMFHFPKKRSKISQALNFIFVSYYDWGVGFKYFRGAENITANFIDVGGTVTSTEENDFKFYYGNLYGRFSLHKNINFKKDERKPTKFFLDNSLGINIDYRLLGSTDDYTWYSVMTENQKYSKPLQIQLHYGLGLGFRLKRGSWLIPGVRTPILGFQQNVPQYGGSDNSENSFGKPSTYWFSSRYWPLLIHIKYMFALEKKSKGCPPVEINQEDANRYRNGG